MLATHNFRCDGCGGLDELRRQGTGATLPFCGGEKLEAQKDAKTLAPKFVVPFRIEQQSRHATQTMDGERLLAAW